MIRLVCMACPRTAYVLLWFPKASEAFIFREVVRLERLGLDLKVYTLYGRMNDHLSPEMQAYSPRVERLGWQYVKKIPAALGYWWRRDRRLVRRVLRKLLDVKWRGLEKSGENIWAALCGFHLARRFEEDGIEHIHAPWATGPATAAWIASLLTGISFSFTARAWDIHPQDGFLTEKITAGSFVRANTRSNVRYLGYHAHGQAHKIRMIYNGMTISDCQPAQVAMRPPYQILAVGRFTFIKGFDVLLRACRLQKKMGLDFRLTLVGDGFLRPYLKALTWLLGLKDRVFFPGFISHDKISALMRAADLFVMPSVLAVSGDRDGIPNVVMEALAHRLPVVSSDISGLGEVIQNEVTGLTVPQRDPAALSRAIGRMLGNREEALGMAEAGRSMVRREFDPGRNIRKIMELFESVAGRKGSGLFRSTARPDSGQCLMEMNVGRTDLSGPVEPGQPVDHVA